MAARFADYNARGTGAYAEDTEPGHRGRRTKKLRIAVGVIFGGVCRKCPGIVKCKDKPTESAPIEMNCVVCEGKGCRKCGGTGRINITGCPLEIVTLETWEFIKFAKLYEKGLPPIAGGVLDQAKGFVDGCSFVFNEIQYWKKKLGIF